MTRRLRSNVPRGSDLWAVRPAQWHGKGLSEDAAELQRRREAWQAPPRRFDRGWLQIYRRNVGQLAQGAVLVDPTQDASS